MNSTLELPKEVRRLEYDREHGCLVRGPDAQAEADLHELGTRVAQELAYQQPTSTDWPA
jgi:hypothetical protein